VNYEPYDDNYWDALLVAVERVVNELKEESLGGVKEMNAIPTFFHRL
jgi:hypothetical protein